jgi:hypothetical protein
MGYSRFQNGMTITNNRRNKAEGALIRNRLADSRKGREKAEGSLIPERESRVK